jgi:ATP-dependent Clp protease ATP-binding subunit ClpC
LDMSEFMERHSVAQMLGAPAGYVGHGEGGKLTETIRRRPYCVVLFDEIEKAHPDVWNILLQILDEGTLTDAEGRQVSFKNTLIILTSNIGTSAFTRDARIGFDRTSSPVDRDTQFEHIKREVLTELKKEMRPELLSRLDQTIVFRPLSAKTIEQITTLELAILAERLKKKGVTLHIGQNVVSQVAKESFAPEQGARLVRKTIQNLVERPIGQALLNHPTKKSFRLTLKKGIIVCS